MDVIIGLIQAVITLGAIAGLIVLTAGIFLIVFSLPVIIDKRTNNQ